MFRRTTVFSATAVPLQVLTSRARGFRFLLANSSYFWVLTKTVLTGVRRYLTLGLICISLTICDVDHLGMGSLTICIYFFLEQCLCKYRYFFIHIIPNPRNKSGEVGTVMPMLYLRKLKP